MQERRQVGSVWGPEWPSKELPDPLFALPRKICLAGYHLRSISWFFAGGTTSRSSEFFPSEGFGWPIFIELIPSNRRSSVNNHQPLGWRRRYFSLLWKKPGAQCNRFSAFYMIYSISSPVYHSEKVLDIFNEESYGDFAIKLRFLALLFTIYLASIRNHFAEQNVKRKNSLFGVLSFFLLFPSLFFAGPEYVECEDLDDDDSLNLFGIPQNSVASGIIRRDLPSIRIFSDFCFKTHATPYHPSWSIYSEPFISEPILLVTLRC